MLLMWLDDCRDPADYGCPGWGWVKTGEAAIENLATGRVEAASLDHDLGSGVSGYDVVCWMEATGTWPRKGVFVHSANTVGRDRMLQVIDRQYPSLVRHRRPLSTPLEQAMLANWLISNSEGS